MWKNPEEQQTLNWLANGKKPDKQTDQKTVSYTFILSTYVCGYVQAQINTKSTTYTLHDKNVLPSPFEGWTKRSNCQRPSQRGGSSGIN